MIRTTRLAAGPCLASLVVLCHAVSAQGSVFKAACAPDPGNPDAGNSPALVGAIQQANSHAGPDTVRLERNCTYTLTAPHNYWYGPNGLPPIASNITIEGNGATIARNGAAPHFRLFFVGADPNIPATSNYVSPGPGKLTLRNVTLAGGFARGGDSSNGGGGGGMGGAIFSQGTVLIERSLLTLNVAVGGASGNTALGLGGGGIGTDAPGPNGGGFGPGSFGGGSGGKPLPNNQGGGGGGGAGFRRNEAGRSADTSGDGAAGGGLHTGLGGSGQESPSHSGGPGGDGSGGGGGGGFSITSGGLGAGGGGVGGGGAFARANSSTGLGGDFGRGGETGFAYSGSGGGGFGGGGGGGEVSTGASGGDGGFGGGGGNYAHGGFGGGDGGFGYGNDPPNPGGGGAGMGGAVFNMQGRLTIRASTLAGNFAVGGGILNDPGPSPYAHFQKNATPGRGFGGAIFNLSGFFTAVGSTLARDYAADGYGTEIFNLAYDAASARTAQATLRDTIVGHGQANVATRVGLVSVLPAKTVGGSVNRGQAKADVSRFDLVETRQAFGGSIFGSPPTADPKLGNLQNNGGPTQTMAPAAGSPVINTGLAFGLTADQRGRLRPYGFARPGSHGDGSDIGAFEIQGPVFGAKTLVTLKLGAKAIPGAGPLPIVVSNLNGFPIIGKLSGKTVDPVPGVNHRIALTGKRFSVAALGNPTVNLGLPQKLRELLKQKGELDLVLKATVRDPARNERTVTKTVKPNLRK